jgi:hypothetical protein
MLPQPLTLLNSQLIIILQSRIHVISYTDNSVLKQIQVTKEALSEALSVPEDLVIVLSGFSSNRIL